MMFKNDRLLPVSALVILVLLATGTGWAQNQDLPAEVIAYADIIFYNGKILVADEAFTLEEGAAIRDGKFLAVGSSERILSMAGPETRRVDLEGRSVIPGLIAGHEHGAFVGNVAKRGQGGSLEFKDVASGLEEIKAEVAKFPPGQELYMRGPSKKPLVVDVTLDQLDAAAPVNPISISCQNNQVIVNSLMLKKLSPDVQGIVKDGNGNPTGQLRGAAAGTVIYEFMPQEDSATQLDRQKQTFRRYFPQGLTTLMGRGQGLTITILRDLWIKGELEPRVRIHHEFLRSQGQPEAFLKRIGNLTNFGDDQFKIIGATVQVVDGSTGNGAAFTDIPKINRVEGDPYDSYGQNKWGETGNVATSDRRNIILANRYGWTIGGLHSAGDRSNTVLLEALYEAHQEKSLVGRHFGIDHQAMLREKHFELMKEMDVVPSFYASAISGDNESWVYQYGADAVYAMTPVKSAINAGLKPIIEIPGGMDAIRAFVTRKSDDGRIWNPEQKVTRQEALYMYTTWAARYSGEQDVLGSIEVGKLGDLVVLAGDYMTWPEDDLDALRVLMTVVGGNVVYEARGAF
jgi:predicted amidohydrolase YtcJ